MTVVSGVILGQIQLYSRDPLVLSVIAEHVAKHTSSTIRGYTGEPGPGRESRGPVIVDTDVFTDIRRITGVLEQRARAGCRTLVLCSFLDAARVPEHENIMKLEKPFRLADILRFVDTTGLQVDKNLQP